MYVREEAEGKKRSKYKKGPKKKKLAWANNKSRKAEIQAMYPEIIDY